MISVRTETFEVRTRGKGTYEITAALEQLVRSSGLREGTATVFVQHTSCSLVIYENADPSARSDLHEFFERLAPESESWHVHTSEGPDDTPSHLRMALTRTAEVIPVTRSRPALGTWQGLFLFEHRRAPHTRRLVVTLMGEFSP